jgi:hypothetical protein
MLSCPGSLADKVEGIGLALANAGGATQESVGRDIADRDVERRGAEGACGGIGCRERRSGHSTGPSAGVQEKKPLAAYRWRRQGGALSRPKLSASFSGSLALTMKLSRLPSSTVWFGDGIEAWRVVDRLDGQGDQGEVGVELAVVGTVAEAVGAEVVGIRGVEEAAVTGGECQRAVLRDRRRGWLSASGCR